MVPTMSKTPISASSVALVVGGMPWSCAAATKWVPIRPLVDQPQIQNVANSTQKTGEREHSRSVRSATLAAPGPSRTTGTGEPAGRRAVRRGADVLGRSRRTHQTSGTSARAKTETRPAAQRQPGPSARWAIAGRNTSWPVELAAENTPTTSAAAPHEPALATIAPKTRASDAGADADREAPQQPQLPGPGHHAASGPEPSATSASAAGTTRRRPKRSISAAANGAATP